MKGKGLTASILALWVVAALARGGARQADQLLERLQGNALASAQGHLEPGTRSPGVLRRRTSWESRFLNEDTKGELRRRVALLKLRLAADLPGNAELAVNSTGIPEVNFDVGESYAGQLPISDRADEQNRLFFWFFPTANEEHKDSREVIIWLNGGISATIGGSPGGRQE